MTAGAAIGLALILSLLAAGRVRRKRPNNLNGTFALVIGLLSFIYLAVHIIAALRRGQRRCHPAALAT
jgi:hypothetical protein